MNLIQKLSTAAVLGSTLAASGCGHVAGALIGGVVNEQQGKANRAAMLEAARIQAGQQNYTAGKLKHNKVDRFFAYKTFLGDGNNNGEWDRKEFDGYELDSYPPLEVKLFAEIYDRTDAVVTINIEEIGVNKIHTMLNIKIESNKTKLILTPSKKYNFAGKSYNVSYSIGNTRLGKVTYTVSEEK
jgi:hypothetical protein